MGLYVNSEIGSLIFARVNSSRSQKIPLWKEKSITTPPPKKVHSILTCTCEVVAAAVEVEPDWLFGVTGSGLGRRVILPNDWSCEVSFANRSTGSWVLSCSGWSNTASPLKFNKHWAWFGCMCMCVYVCVWLCMCMRVCKVIRIVEI